MLENEKLLSCCSQKMSRENANFFGLSKSELARVVRILKAPRFSWHCNPRIISNCGESRKRILQLGMIDLFTAWLASPLTRSARPKMGAKSSSVISIHAEFFRHCRSGLADPNVQLVLVQAAQLMKWTPPGDLNGIEVPKVIAIGSHKPNIRRNPP